LTVVLETCCVCFFVHQVWNQCVETIICPKNGSVTEAYAVAAHEFSTLFNMESPIDRRTFAEMQRVACLNFKMDKVSAFWNTRFRSPNDTLKLCKEID
jgi:hypothetical protein